MKYYVYALKTDTVVILVDYTNDEREITNFEGLYFNGQPVKTTILGTFEGEKLAKFKSEFLKALLIEDDELGEYYGEFHNSNKNNTK